jgi:hypothetical protein
MHMHMHMHATCMHMHMQCVCFEHETHMWKVSTLTALLQPGGAHAVTLVQRVDYLEAEVAELRSQLAPQGGGGQSQWRPARSYAR